MPRELFGVVGTSTPDQLLYDPLGADKIVVPVEPGSGTVKRGTIVYRKASGLWAPAAAENIVTTNVFAILDETVVVDATPAEGKTATAEDAIAFRSGIFINGRVTLASDGTVTEAHKVVLLRQGIKFDHKVETAGFTNSVTTPEE